MPCSTEALPRLGRAAARTSVLLALWLTASPAHPAGAADATIRIADWTFHRIFAWDTDRCSQSDTPDMPPRAFRDASGNVHLIATHEDNRAFVGTDFDHLRHPCRVIYTGKHLDAPQLYSDRQWLTSFWTDDGRNVFALVHNEFQGDLRPDFCPSRRYLSCWQNSLTFAESHDGGETFTERPGPQNLVAAVPYRYQGEIGHPVGYFQPSNIVRWNGFYYVMFHATRFADQDWGTCVARTDDLADPRAWRAWDGEHFAITFEDRYATSEAEPAREHVCRPVGKESMFGIGSLSFDTAAQRAIAITGTNEGAYLAISADFVHWSAATPVLVSDDLRQRDPVKSDRYGDFSLIDEDSDDRSFSTIDGRSNIYLYFVASNQSHPPYDRALFKIRAVLTLDGQRAAINR